jgi:hypothetical protein
MQLLQDDMITETSFRTWLEKGQALIDPDEDPPTQSSTASCLNDPLTALLKGGAPFFHAGGRSASWVQPLLDTPVTPPTQSVPTPTSALSTSPEIVLHESTLQYIALLAYKLSSDTSTVEVVGSLKNHECSEEAIEARSSGRRSSAPPAAVPSWHLPFKIVQVPTPPLNAEAGYDKIPSNGGSRNAAPDMVSTLTYYFHGHPGLCHHGQ